MPPQHLYRTLAAGAPARNKRGWRGHGISMSASSAASGHRRASSGKSLRSGVIKISIRHRCINGAKWWAHQARGRAHRARAKHQAPQRDGTSAVTQARARIDALAAGETSASAASIALRVPLARIVPLAARLPRHQHLRTRNAAASSIGIKSISGSAASRKRGAPSLARASIITARRLHHFARHHAPLIGRRGDWRRAASSDARIIII